MRFTFILRMTQARRRSPPGHMAKAMIDTLCKTFGEKSSEQCMDKRRSIGSIIFMVQFQAISGRERAIGNLNIDQPPRSAGVGREGQRFHSDKLDG